MSTDGNGTPRYARQSSPLPPRQQGPDGRDLGPAMRPREIYSRVRFALQTMGFENNEILDMYAAAAERLQRDLGPHRSDPPALPELSVEDRRQALTQARDVTGSRLVAWRKGTREMTWLELRALLLGIVEYNTRPSNEAGT